MIGLVALQTPIPEPAADVVGIAASFHDAAIWFDKTWDYLPPSAARALAELGPERADQADLASALITEHHRVRKARHDDPLVEAFRRADLTDVSAGLIGVPGAKRKDYKALTSQYPANGFRPMLVKAFGRGINEHPLHPIPMMKF